MLSVPDHAYEVYEPEPPEGVTLQVTVVPVYADAGDAEQVAERGVLTVTLLEQVAVYALLPLSLTTTLADLLPESV